MCLASRPKVEFTRSRSHYLDEEGFVADIASICRERLIRFVLPSHNETEILVRHRARLGSGFDALLPDAGHCALFNDKARGYDSAQDCGVLVPLRVTYSNAGELAESLKGHGLDCSVIKLRTGNSSAKVVFYARSPGGTAETVRRLAREFELPDDRLHQIQEYVSGEGWGYWVFYRHGRQVSSFTHRRVREKIATGWHVSTMQKFKVYLETGKFCFEGENP